MTPRDAIKKLREAKVPEELILPLENLLPLLVSSQEVSLSEALKRAHAAWAEREQGLGREPGAAFPIPPGLDDD